MIQHLLGCYKPLTLFKSSSIVGSNSCCLFFSVSTEGKEFGTVHFAFFLILPMLVDASSNNFFVYGSVPFSIQGNDTVVCSKAFRLRKVINKTRKAYCRSPRTCHVGYCVHVDHNGEKPLPEGAIGISVFFWFPCREVMKTTSMFYSRNFIV